MSGSVGERTLLYVDEHERVPLDVGIVLLVGEPFEEKVGQVGVLGGEQFTLTNNRVAVKAVGFDMTLGEITVHSFNAERANVEHLLKAQVHDDRVTEALLAYDPSFGGLEKLYRKSSIRLVLPMPIMHKGTPGWELYKLTRIEETPGRLKIAKQDRQENIIRIAKLSLELWKARSRRGETADTDDVPWSV